MLDKIRAHWSRKRSMNCWQTFRWLAEKLTSPVPSELERRPRAWNYLQSPFPLCRISIVGKGILVPRTQLPSPLQVPSDSQEANKSLCGSASCHDSNQFKTQSYWLLGCHAGLGIQKPVWDLVPHRYHLVLKPIYSRLRQYCVYLFSL
jgi:hypothetical protein